MDYVVTSLRENPELAIFLTLALGFVFGRLRIGSFTLGSVVGTLLAGVLIGQLVIPIAPIVKTVFFDLFLFATVYKVGPQFFRGLKKNALAQVALTVVLCATSLVTTIVAAKIFGYDAGTAAGLMAGARRHWVTIAACALFLVPGPVILVQLKASGRIPAFIGDSWAWERLIVAHQAWALFGLLWWLVWLRWRCAKEAVTQRST